MKFVQRLFLMLYNHDYTIKNLISRVRKSVRSYQAGVHREHSPLRGHRERSPLSIKTSQVKLCLGHEFDFLGPSRIHNDADIISNV